MQNKFRNDEQSCNNNVAQKTMNNASYSAIKYLVHSSPSHNKRRKFEIMKNTRL